MGGFSGGFQAGLNRSALDHAHKQALTDEEHEQTLQDHNNTIMALQQKMSLAGEGSPEYSGLQNQLNQVISDRTSLFHPDRPNGLERLGKMLWQKVHGNTAAPTETTQYAPQAGASMSLPTTLATPELPAFATAGTTAPGNKIPTFHENPGTAASSQPGMASSAQLPAVPAVAVAHPPTTPAEIKARAGQELAWGAPGVPNQYTQHHQQLVAAGFSEQDAMKATRIFAGLDPKPVQYGLRPTLKPFKYADGTPGWYDAADPDTLPEGAVPVLPGSAGQIPKVGSFGDFMAAAYGPRPTPEQYEQGRGAWASSAAGTTVGEHTIEVPQPDGSIKVYIAQTTSTKQFPGGTSLPSTRQDTATPPGATAPSPASPNPGLSTAPKSPADLKAKVKQVHAGVVGGGAVLGGRPTPAQTKADEQVNEDTALAAQADMAIQTPSASKDKAFVTALVRTAANRFNLTEYDNLVRGAGIANSLNQYIVSAESGELTPEIRKQLVEVTHDMLRASQAGAAQAHGTNKEDDDFLMKVK